MIKFVHVIWPSHVTCVTHTYIHGIYTQAHIHICVPTHAWHARTYMACTHIHVYQYMHGMHTHTCVPIHTCHTHIYMPCTHTLLIRSSWLRLLSQMDAITPMPQMAKLRQQKSQRLGSGHASGMRTARTLLPSPSGMQHTLRICSAQSGRHQICAQGQQPLGEPCDSLWRSLWYYAGVTWGRSVLSTPQEDFNQPKSQVVM